MVRERNAEGHRVLSTVTIAIWAVGLLAVGALAVTLLWISLGDGGSRDSVRLDIIRTAASIMVGTGGAAALLLAARRQRVTELDVKQKDYDATERRVTELYSKAADQLGNDKAPVRLAGLYALERLAQENPAHRQTIVDLVCAYLRMPARPAPAQRGATSRAEEDEVRHAAQELLAKHLRPGDAADAAESPRPGFWPGIDINLSGATLTRFVFTHCVVRSAQFAGTTFVGAATFRGTIVEQTADFRNARFLGLADFRRSSLGAEGKPFRGAIFEGEADFGTHTVVALAGARTRTSRGTRRKWPSGWTELKATGDSWASLVPQQPARDHREPTWD